MIEQKQLHYIINSVLNQIKIVIEQHNLGVSFYTFHDIPINTDNPSTTLTQIFFSKKECEIIYEIIRQAVSKIETVSGLSSRLSFSFIKELSSLILKLIASDISHKEIREQIQKDNDIFWKFCKSKSIHPTKDNLKLALESSIKNKKAIEMALESFYLAGLNGKIFIEKYVREEKQNIIEYKSGYNFFISSCLSTDNITGWNYKNVKCLIIDGFIENITELHNIFEQSSKLKEPIAIFCRGYNQDILSTIQANRIRKTLNVIPLQINFDLESVNILNDIAVVCRSDVYSSLKGDIIFNIKYEELPIVSSLNYQNQEVCIINELSEYNVNTHIKNLEIAKEEQKLDDVKQIYEKRIRSLMANSAIIKLYGAEREIQNLLESIDSCLRLLKGMLRYGTIRPQEATNELPTTLSAGFKQVLFKTLSGASGEHLSLAVIHNILKYGIDCCLNICLASGLILKS